MQSKIKNNTNLSHLRNVFLSNLKSYFWIFLLATVVVGPLIRYMESLVSFAFAFSSINSITYLPSTFANGGLFGAIAACFSIGTKQSPTKTATAMFIVSTSLILVSSLYMDVHGMIQPLQYRAAIGDGMLDIIFPTATGFVLPLAVRGLNLSPTAS